MTKILWDQTGEKTYETGVSNGVLYIPDGVGDYSSGFGWNGLTAVTESPSGAEATAQYADNIKYLSLTSAEEFGATIEAFTYPDEFGQCDGTAEPVPGVALGQQERTSFGLCYRTILGNDLLKNGYGYKLHLIYGATAAPSEKAYATVNDSPEPITFSWEVTTVPAEVGTIGSTTYKPTASITIDSTKVDADALTALEEVLYGTVGTDPTLPAPADVIALFDGTITTTALPTAPTYNSTTDLVTIPVITGVIYKRNGVVVTGDVAITANTVFTASPAPGYKFPLVADDDWLIVYV